MIGLREDIKDCKERLTQKHQEMRCLENEYQIVRIQVRFWDDDDDYDDSCYCEPYYTFYYTWHNMYKKPNPLGILLKGESYYKPKATSE